MHSAGIKLLPKKGNSMKYLALLLLSLPALADSIPLPTGGFVWTTPISYTAGNIEGEYSPSMPVIYALQFGDLTSQFYFKLGSTEYTGTFSNWSFDGGLFSGAFSGLQINFYPDSWSYYSLSPISGFLTQQLDLIAGCQGYTCGSMAFGSLALSEVPEPATMLLVLTGLSLALLMKGNCEHSFRTR
jgi:hypothetical protein